MKTRRCRLQNSYSLQKLNLTTESPSSNTHHPDYISVLGIYGVSLQNISANPCVEESINGHQPHLHLGMGL